MEGYQDNKLIISFHPSNWILVNRLLWALWLPVVVIACYILKVLPFPQIGLNLLGLIWFVYFLVSALYSYGSVLAVYPKGVAIIYPYWHSIRSMDWDQIDNFDKEVDRRWSTWIFRQIWGEEVKINFYSSETTIIAKMSYCLSELDQADSDKAEEEITSLISEAHARKAAREIGDIDD